MNLKDTPPESWRLCPWCGWKVAHVGYIAGYDVQTCMARDCFYSTRPALMDTLKPKEQK